VRPYPAIHASDSLRRSTSRPSAFQRDTLPSPTCSPDRWRDPPETRFSWQTCTVSCFRIVTSQSATTVVCHLSLARAQAPPNQHAGRHHSTTTTTTTATLVAHALCLTLARRPGPHSFTGNSIRRRRTHSLVYYTHQYCRPIETRSRWNYLDWTNQHQARAGHHKRQQEAALHGTTPSDHFRYSKTTTNHYTHAHTCIARFDRIPHRLS
jgi:hypothetical protein